MARSTVLSEQLRVHLRTVLPVGAVVVAGILASGLLLIAYAGVIGAVAFAQIAALATTPDTATATLVLLMVPIVLGALVALLAWAGVATQVASGASLKRRVSLGGAVARSVTRLPRAAVVGLAAVLLVLLAVVLTPLFVAAGILGLIATPFVRRSRFAVRWPRLGVLVLLAVPLGVAAWMLVRVSLALPSVWISGTGIRAAFADSAARVRGREVPVGLVFLLSSVVTAGITEGAAALAAPLGDTAVLVVRIAALVVVGPLLLAGLVVQYQRAGTPHDLPPVAAPAQVRRRARVAVAALFAMMLPLIVVGGPAPAQAAGTTVVTFSLQTTDNPVPAGSPTTVQFTVRDSSSETQQPTGSLQVTIDGQLLPGPFALPGGALPVELERTFTAGQHLIEAEYSGDDTYASASQSLTFTAGPPADPIHTTTSFTVTPDSPSAAGAPLTAHVLVIADDGSYPTGSVRILLDGTGSFLADSRLETAAHGAIDLVFSLPPGMQRVVAYFEADAAYQSSNIDLTQTVSPDSSVVALTPDAAITVFGQSLGLSATVGAATTPTGTVDFEARPVGAHGPSIGLGPAPLVAGVAELSTTALPVGAFELVAVYSGDSSVESAESVAVVHTVGKAAVSVGVVPSIPAPSFGDTLGLAVTVGAAAPGAGSPTGSVIVKRDGTTVGSGALVAGTVSVAIPSGDAGSRTFTVEYSGDGSFQAGAGSLVLAVAQLPTITRLTGAADRSHTYGDSQTYAGTVATADEDTTPTGTVELWVGGYHVADGTLDGAGAYSITTGLAPVTPDFPTTAWIVYLGDTNHESSQVQPADRPSLEMTQAASVPELTASPDEVGIGTTVTLTATLAQLGAGPTGTVTFSSLEGVIGSAPVVDGVAEYDFVVAQTTTRITASYSGDDNFSAESSDALVLQATRAAATVTLTGPATYPYGSLVDLVATVSIGGGGVPDHGVEFRSTDIVLASDVPVVAGTATLTVCAGSASVCPGGVPVIGAGDTNLTARYVEGATNLEGVSAPVAYTVAKAATSLDLSVTPTTTQLGSAVFLVATVSAAVTPTGVVSFYGSEPTTGGGETLAYLGMATLVDGVASLEVTAGNGPDDLRWPAEAITAIYVPGGAPFTASRDTVAIDLLRVASQVTVTAAAAAAHAPTTVTAQLAHDAGASADFTGTVVITTDTGESCTVHLTAGASTASCDFTWTGVGAHDASATYSGDLVYLPAGSATAAVPVGKGTAVLGASAPFDVAVGETVTARWNQFDAHATGTVTVWGDGTQWCEVDVLVGECSGTFGAASATGASVDIVVRYSGDATWNGVQDELSTRVTNCATLDVRSGSALGTVTVDTAPNCGSSGYLVGTVVRVTAHPTPGNEFVNWQGYGASGLEPVATTLSTTFTPTRESETWVRVASFRVPCYPVLADATGSGGIAVFPVSNCATPDGSAGWLRGTALIIYPEPTANPVYGELDVFHSFGTVSGGVLGLDPFGRPRIALTVSSAITVPIVFGPRCHVVTVAFDPAGGGDLGAATTPENCTSPTNSGYLRGTVVTVGAKLADPDRALAGWSIDGVPQPQLDGKPQAILTIGDGDPLVTARIATCYTLDLKVDGALDPRSREIGQVDVDVKPNCSDGSLRYLAGTVVTAIPTVLVDGAIFSGWDDNRVNMPPVDKTGPVPAGTRVFAMTESIAAAAGFFLDTVCSRLTILGDPSVLAFDDTGCGPGYYFDLQKQSAIRGGEPQASYWQDRFRSVLSVKLNPDEPLNAYVSILGDTRNCFGNAATEGAPSTDAAEWKSYGPLTDSSDCRVGGPISVRIQACQTLATDPLIVVDGVVHSGWSVPASVYLPDENGSIAGYSTEGFNWVTGLGVSVNGDGSRAYEGFGNGACGAAGSAYPAGSDLALIASSPGDWFTFIGWRDSPDTVLPTNPLFTTASDTEGTLDVSPVYETTCRTVTFGEGVTIDGDAAYCPGSSPDQNLFVAGSAIPVRAEARLADGRWGEKFTSGVNSKPIFRDEATNDLMGFVYVDADYNVKVFYPTDGQRFTSALTQVLKVGVGILAVAAPIVLGILFPPAGILFAVIGAASGIASLAGSDKAAAVFDLINPTKIMVCAARWSFGNAGDPTGGNNLGSILSTGNKIQQVINGKDVLTPTLSNIGVLTGSASFVVGLYTSGITHTDLEPQTVDELRDTQTMTGCLDDQWRAAGSNLSGSDSSPVG